MKRNLLVLIAAVAIVIAAATLAMTMYEDRGSKDFVIIHTGDTHGYIDDGCVS